MLSKVKAWFKRYIGKKEAAASELPQPPEFPEVEEAHERLKEAREHLERAESHLRVPRRGLPPPTTEQAKEEIAREHWLPKPTTRRRRIPDRSRPPASQHTDAISKHMKGKGRFHQQYRRMIKKHTSRDEMEED